MGSILVAYFSATNRTERLAKTVAQATGGTLYKITPEVPYTSADLNWNNKQSRSSVEMADKSFRPAITGKVEGMEKFDSIFVGFPVWWYVAPTIINSFLEMYNLIGKTIIPFATSGGSGMGGTNADLKASCTGAMLKEGAVFPSRATVEDIKAWAKAFV